MNAPFFVTGLPRSRGAWLANFLTAQGALCIHDGLIHGVDAATRWLKKDKLRGLSDSTLPLRWQELFPQFDSYRLVIVEREPETCWQSLLRFLDYSEVRVPRAALEKRFADVNAQLLHMRDFPHLRVTFEALENLTTLRDIWEHCLPGLPFDEERTNLLQRLNVQQKVSAVRVATL